MTLKNPVKYNFFTTSDTIYENPFESFPEENLRVVKTELEREFFKTISIKLINKKILNRHGTSWTRCLKYVLWKYKPKNVLIITTMSNYHFNIKNDVCCSIMTTDDFRTSNTFYDVCFKDVTVDVDDESFIKAAYTIEFETRFNFNRQSLNSCIDIDTCDNKFVNVNPQKDPYSYIVLNDQLAFDKMFLLANEMNKKLSSKKLLVMTKEPEGSIYAGIQLSINFKQDVCLVFNNRVYKLEYKKIPNWFYEPEECDIPLEYNFDEIKDCVTLDRHYNVSTYQYICGTNDDLQDFFSECDYVFCTYLQSYRLLRRNHKINSIYFYSEPRRVIDMILNSNVIDSDDNSEIDLVLSPEDLVYIDVSDY